MPQLTPMLRLAFALASVFALVPLIVVLGVYELSPLTVTGIPRSGATIAVGVAAGVVFVAFWALVVTAWNPLHRADVAMTDLSARAAAQAPPTIQQSPIQRIVGAAVVLAVFLLINWLALEGVRSITEALK